MPLTTQRSGLCWCCFFPFLPVSWQLATWQLDIERCEWHPTHWDNLIKLFACPEVPLRLEGKTPEKCSQLMSEACETDLLARITLMCKKLGCSGRQIGELHRELRTHQNCCCENACGTIKILTLVTQAASIRHFLLHMTLDVCFKRHDIQLHVATKQVMIRKKGFRKFTVQNQWPNANKLLKTRKLRSPPPPQTQDNPMHWKDALPSTLISGRRNDSDLKFRAASDWGRPSLVRTAGVKVRLRLKSFTGKWQL